MQEKSVELYASLTPVRDGDAVPARMRAEFDGQTYRIDLESDDAQDISDLGRPQALVHKTIKRNHEHDPAEPNTDRIAYRIIKLL